MNYKLSLTLILSGFIGFGSCFADSVAFMAPATQQQVSGKNVIITVTDMKYRGKMTLHKTLELRGGTGPMAYNGVVAPGIRGGAYWIGLDPSQTIEVFFKDNNGKDITCKAVNYGCNLKISYAGGDTFTMYSNGSSSACAIITNNCTIN